MTNTNSRRQFFAGAAASVAGLAVARSALAGLPEPVIQTSVETAPPLIPTTGRPYNPVVTLNGWTLPWRMNDGVKEFHLVAEPVVREVAGRRVGFLAVSCLLPPDYAATATRPAPATVGADDDDGPPF